MRKGIDNNMEEKDFELVFPLDYGLTVQYDGEDNTVFYDGIKKYGVGEMMCELARVWPSELKDFITGYEGFSEDFNLDNFDKAFNYLEKKICDKFGVVSARIIVSEFLDLGEDLYKNHDNPEYWKVVNSEDSKSPEIHKFIYEGTGFEGAGVQNIGQMFLTIYEQFAVSYVAFKYLFMNTMDSLQEHEEGDEVEVKVLGLYGSMVGAQHIDYRLMCIEGGFASVYTIKSCMSLLAFEFAHAYQKNVFFNKCKNCGNYFVLSGRSDAIYCSYPDPKHDNRLCKDIGAQITRANKEKNDVSTREYRKVYMRLNMHLKRHPGDSAVRKSLDKLTSEIKTWRSDLAQGAVTVEEFLEWLKQF